MFYQGDIQSGIAAAMREAKPVVCFVRDDEEESAQWEDQYFDDNELRELLSNSAVTLRLVAGTQEAGFLTSIFPIQKFPTVIVIRNGTLQECLVNGTPQDVFQTRLKTAITTPTDTNTAPTTPSAPISNPSNNDTDQQVLPHTARTTGTTNDNLNQVQASIAATTTSQSQTPSSNDSTRDDFMQASSDTHVPTRQATNEITEPLRRQNIREGKQPERQETPEEKKASQETKERRAMQLKIQQEQKAQKEERERIRNQIKHDQELRRKRAAEEKTSLDFEASTSQTTSAGATGNRKSGKKQASEYRLQIRLFDGSSVRNTFPPTATIRSDVRPWLESQRSDDSQPYNLKHILTPLPNRNISVSEEELPLKDLELGPTASLVMVPVQSYIEAYAPPAVMNSLPGRVVSSGYGLVSGVVGGVAGMVGGFLGYGSSSSSQAAATTSDTSSEQNAGSAAATRTRNGPTVNIRTLHDQRNDNDKNELYNGNTLNFEPRRDDGSKDK